MARTMTRTLAAVAMAVAAFTFAGAPVGAAERPIGPNQHFVGRVNGTRPLAVVFTVCGGPTWAGRTGPVAGGQTLSVARARKGHGYTGPFTSVYAWFVPPSGSSTTAPVQLAFTSYNARQVIPASVTVPCDGIGLVEFSSCPYLAPCAYGWVSDYVLVRFVNLAL